MSRFTTLRAGAFALGRVPVDAILPLRHAVLRPGLPAASARWEGDNDATTIHYAAVDADGAPAACATLLLNEWEGRPARQLRGMAVREDLARRGLGSALLRFIEADLMGEPPDLLWANARKLATPFYVKHGWVIASDEFHIETVGPHYRITRRLSNPSR